MRIALVEDLSADQKRMKEVLDALSKELSFSYTLSTFANGFDFMESYKPVYDLVLMDIEMAKMNGLETAERLRKVDSNVLLIFITNMAQYALKGYQYQALDYVLKPVKEADMKMRFLRVMKFLSKNAKNFVIQRKNGPLRVSVKDIVYIESKGHDLFCHLQNEVIEFRGYSMKQLEEQLAPDGFSRCNTGYLVNLEHCTKIEGTTLYIGDGQLEISRKRRKAFLEDFLRYNK